MHARPVALRTDWLTVATARWYTTVTMPPETLTKTERVFAALRGESVDRVPVSAWWHDFPREWSAASLAEATIEAYKKYGWDFVKVNPRASYYAEDWGPRYLIADGAKRQPVLAEPGISVPEHLGGKYPAV